MNITNGCPHCTAPHDPSIQCRNQGTESDRTRAARDFQKFHSSMIEKYGERWPLMKDSEWRKHIDLAAAMYRERRTA
jgi:hypothetical protein